MEPSAPHRRPPDPPAERQPGGSRATADEPTAPAAVIPLRTLDRSPRSFSTFYRDEYERFVRVAFLILDSREQAEEVVQDAFVRLHGRWSTVDEPRSYLRATVVNRCRDVVRRRVRWRRRVPELASPSAWSDEPDELFDALSHLSVRQRTVVVLRYYEQMQEAEIAAVVGIKVGTVKSTLHRSIELLRKEIEP